MSHYNVLLLCGGGSDEHDISLISADFIQTQLAQFSEINVTKLILEKNGAFYDSKGDKYALEQSGQLINTHLNQPSIIVDFVIPCFHGFPGETGDIQSYLTLKQLPFLGVKAEASMICFNKITTKQWLTALDIPNTPYLFLSEMNQSNLERVQLALRKWGSIFIKAANQGSSVGCYKVDDETEVESTLKLAFTHSPYVLVEKTINARELEVAAYEYQGKLTITPPGEIICDQSAFYDFNEKYSTNSKARTDIVAQKIDENVLNKIKEYSEKAFKGMKLRHLSRIDFFLTPENEVLLNEINTFPGMTPISMFPKMLENHGDNFGELLVDIIKQEVKGHNWSIRLND